MEDLKRCPFCGGKAKFSIRQMGYFGHNVFGQKRIKIGGQVICQRCHARGSLFSANVTIPGNEKQLSTWIKESAENAWNRRVNDA